MEINGVSHRVVQFEGGNWIEGIGNDRGLFMEVMVNISNYWTYQECVLVDDELIFDHEQGELNCSVLSVENPEKAISIYPNPSNGFIEIEGLNEFFAIEVIDQQGRLVLSKTNDIQTRSRLDLSELKSGLFILRIHFENFVSSHRIIIE